MYLAEIDSHQSRPKLDLPCADAFNRYAPPVARLMQSLPQSVFVQGQYTGLMVPPLSGNKFKQWITLEGCRCFVKSIWSCSKDETNTVIYEKLTADLAADPGFPNASAAFLPEHYNAAPYKSLSFLSVEPFKGSASLYDLFYGEANGKPTDTDNFLTAMKHHPEIIADFVRLASCDLWTGNEDRHSANIVMNLKSETEPRQICGIDPVHATYANYISEEGWRTRISEKGWKIRQAPALRQLDPTTRNRALDEAISTIEAYPDERIYERATRLNQLGHKGWNGESVADILMTRKRMLRAQTAIMLRP